MSKPLYPMAGRRRALGVLLAGLMAPLFAGAADTTLEQERLYAATAYGWWWMRRRLRERELSAETHQRLLRVEVAAVITLVLLEGSQLLQHG
ncbi:MAG: hypothetical protein J0H59_19950 [Comamonadaceae bacterium]|nr:hypothetical protein [Comamonadaceae bacterium]